MKEYSWTDCSVVLGYINNDARQFHTFVANRVQKIHHCTKPQQWCCVPTVKNPADGASRGKTINELLTLDWFTGPMFPWEKELCMDNDAVPEIFLGDPEVKKAHALHTKTTDTMTLIDRLSKFSSWSRAVGAVARLLRRVKKIKSHALSTVNERESAESVINPRSDKTSI